MNIQDRYSWEAELDDGTLLTKGGDLTGAVRFSLLPMNPLLPRHDFTGVKMERRFCRGFLKALGGGLKEYVHCLVCAEFRVYVKSNGGIIITPKEYELNL